MQELGKFSLKRNVMPNGLKNVRALMSIIS